MILMGEIGGHTLVFKELSPNSFTSDLPSLIGVHYIKLRVVDDAGNITDEVHSVALIDFDNMCFKLLPPNYCETDSIIDYGYRSSEDEYDFRYIVKDYCFNLLEPRFGFRLLGGV